MDGQLAKKAYNAYRDSSKLGLLWGVSMLPTNKVYANLKFHSGKTQKRQNKIIKPIKLETKAS